MDDSITRLDRSYNLNNNYLHRLTNRRQLTEPRPHKPIHYENHRRHITISLAHHVRTHHIYPKILIDSLLCNERLFDAS
jgi:hypothetical protein